jgi:hypothetical protein
MYRSACLAAVLALLTPPALADTADAPVTTSSSAQLPAPQSQSNAPPLTAQGAAADDDDGGQRVVMGACGPTGATPDGKPDTAPHGEVEAGIGTNGYRHLAGRVCKPIGDGGSLSIGVGTTSLNGGGWRR